jgi:uncharacterized glyoxalase superfamily metalloenzyme YdcJ
MYGREVPAHETLVEVTREVNAHVVARRGDAAQRLGDLGRVTAERHGTIRVGTLVHDPMDLYAAEAAASLRDAAATRGVPITPSEEPS